MKISKPLLAAHRLEPGRAPILAIRSRAVAGGSPDTVGALKTMNLFKVLEELTL